MKISILSDIHLGHALGTERENDPFDVLEEFLEKNIDSDLILLAGDIFDSRSPRTDVITRAMKLFLKPLLSEKKIKIADGIGKDISQLSPMHSMGIPMVAIAGTHERRARSLINIIEALEQAGFFIYLHCNGVVLEKNNEKVCIQGLSGVPEQFVESVLKEWNPKPVEGCVNILMLHQNLMEFMYAKEGLNLSHLPKGFDLYVSGHIHNPQKKKLGKGMLLICGSPVTTQLKEEETKEKGFWMFDTQKTPKLNFAPFESARKVYIKSFTSDTKIEKIIKEIEKILSESHRKKPIIKIGISGKQAEIPTKEILAEFEDRAIIYFKKDFEEDEKMPARPLEEHKLSVQELGRKLLIQNLKEMDLEPEVFENIFELLAEGNADKVMELLNKKSEKAQSSEKQT